MSKKRQYVRIPFALDVGVRGSLGDFMGKTQQISTTGLIIILDHVYPSGTILWLKLFLPLMDKPIIARGKVTFGEKTLGGNYALYCSFVELKKEDWKGISDFCMVQEIEEPPKVGPWPKPRKRHQFVERQVGPTDAWYARDFREGAEERSDTDEDLAPPMERTESLPEGYFKVPELPNHPDALSPPEDAQYSSQPEMATASFCCYTISFENPQVYLAEYSHNISRGGVFISTTHPPRLHTFVSLRIMLPYGRGSFYCDAKVIWTRTDSEPKGMGVRFVDMDDETVKALESYAEEVAFKAKDVTLVNWKPGIPDKS